MTAFKDQIEEAIRGIATWPKWMREAAHRMTDEPSVLGAGCGTSPAPETLPLTELIEILRSATCSRHWAGIQAAALLISQSDEIERLEAQHSQGLAEMEKIESALKRIIELADPENQDCLPGCDSIAHDELCSWAHPEAVMAKIATEALG